MKSTCLLLQFEHVDKISQISIKFHKNPISVHFRCWILHVFPCLNQHQTAWRPTTHHRQGAAKMRPAASLWDLVATCPTAKLPQLTIFTYFYDDSPTEELDVNPTVKWVPICSNHGSQYWTINEQLCINPRKDWVFRQTSRSLLLIKYGHVPWCVTFTSKTESEKTAPHQSLWSCHIIYRTH